MSEHQNEERMKELKDSTPQMLTDEASSSLWSSPLSSSLPISLAYLFMIWITIENIRKEFRGRTPGIELTA
uniref:Uncharacterized protein n=1 Tax=Cucumis melo TaxID=3656 RepID=A0A9I9E4B8_CUCME